MINRIFRLISLLFICLSTLMILLELSNPTLKGLEKTYFFVYVVTAIALAINSFLKSKNTPWQNKKVWSS